MIDITKQFALPTIFNLKISWLFSDHLAIFFLPDQFIDFINRYCLVPFCLALGDPSEIPARETIQQFTNAPSLYSKRFLFIVSNWIYNKMWKISPVRFQVFNSSKIPLSNLLFIFNRRYKKHKINYAKKTLVLINSQDFLSIAIFWICIFLFL